MGKGSDDGGSPNTGGDTQDGNPNLEVIVEGNKVGNGEADD